MRGDGAFSLVLAIGALMLAVGGVLYIVAIMTDDIEDPRTDARVNEGGVE